MTIMKYENHNNEENETEENSHVENDDKALFRWRFCAKATRIPATMSVENMFIKNDEENVCCDSEKGWFQIWQIKNKI